MSGISMRAMALSLACVLVAALSADAAPRGGGGGGGGGFSRGGGGGGGGGFARGGGGGGGARFSAPAVRSFGGGGGGGARFSAPAARSFGGGGAAFARPGVSGGRSFGGARTFSRPTLGSRSFSRPGISGSRLTYSPRTLRGGRAIHSGRFAGRPGVRGSSTRLGTRSLANRRGLADRSSLANRRLGGRAALADRRLGDRRLGDRRLGDRRLGDRRLGDRRLGDQRLGDQRLGGRAALADRLGDRANFGDRRFGANANRFGGLNRSGRFASCHSFHRKDWHRHWRGHRSAFFGWVGPVFWPYAYDDLFYDAFWGYGGYGGDEYYEDPFWAYGYGDIYGGLFSPYGYDDLAGWASAPATRVARGSGRAAVARGGDRGITTGSLPPSNRWAQMCGDDTREVVGLPVERIQEIVKPDDAQRALLDELGNASVKAAQAIKAACPTDYSLTPTGRLAAMEQRLQAVRLAVDTVRPAMDAFYNSLTDEQKARLNAAGQPQRAGSERRSFAQDCGAASPATEWPADRINRMVQPTEAQRASLERLREASAKAADMLKSSCPTQTLSTPPARLAAMSSRLEVMAEAVRTVRAAAEEFYGSLSDEQKAQFNSIGQARAAK